MKEYWVNVTLDKFKQFAVYDNKNASDIWIKAPWHKAIYRLHVREFETKEAKELYLKMKYGKPPVESAYWDLTT